MAESDLYGVSFRSAHKKWRSSSSESDSDDDDAERVDWKRAKKIDKPKPSTPFSNPLTCPKPSPALNVPSVKVGNRIVKNVWGSALAEDAFEGQLKQFNMKGKPGGNVVHVERGVETFDYHALPNFSVQNSFSPLDNSEKECEADFLTADTGASRKAAKSRLGKRSYDKSKSRSHINISVDDPASDVVKAICKHLQEENTEIIERAVNAVGNQKCLELLYLTEDIQERGGMPTFDGTRMRTAGGVFLQMLKSDKEVNAKKRREIFYKNEMEREFNRERKRRQRERRRRVGKQLSSAKEEAMREADEMDVHEADSNSGRLGGSDDENPRDQQSELPEAKVSPKTEQFNVKPELDEIRGRQLEFPAANFSPKSEGPRFYGSLTENLKAGISPRTDEFHVKPEFVEFQTGAAGPGQQYDFYKTFERPYRVEQEPRSQKQVFVSGSVQPMSGGAAGSTQSAGLPRPLEGHSQTAVSREQLFSQEKAPPVRTRRSSEHPAGQNTDEIEEGEISD